MISNFVFSYLKENKKYFLAGLAWVVFCIVVYFLFPLSEADKHAILLSVKKQISSLSNFMHSPFQTWLVIFLNNALIFFIILLCGFALSTFGMFLVLSQIIAIFVVVSIWLEKIGTLKSLALLVPHGVFEITAFVLVVGLMFKLTVLIVKKVWNRKTVKIGKDVKNVFKFFFFVIIPLTAFAAFVEAFITPLFI